MTPARSRSLSLAVFVLTLATAATAHAVPLRSSFGGPRGFGTQCLGPNDDGSSAAIDLTAAFPRGLAFFGTTHTQVFVNTNGNISFGGGVGEYTPRAFPVASQPMIAPYWADVDIRGEMNTCARSGGARAACEDPVNNGVWWHLRPGQMIVTWHAVGYYECHTDLRMSFQLVLTEVPGSSCGTEGADFDVEMRYARCEWTTGDASGGTGGLGGTEAQAGFDAGNGRDFVMLPRSRMPNIHTRLCNGSNVEMPGIWRFQIRGGAVICPDAGAACETGMPGACGAGRMSCVGEGTACVAELAPSAERCNAIDDDCDGMADEDAGLCPGSQICDRGACIDTCFEGGCGEGLVCDAIGACVDDGCDSVTCAAGQRCEAGACVDACGGVVCPAGRECRAGRCTDACATLDCGECGACDAGACVPRCDADSCAAGSTCVEGVCIPSACASCAPGTACRDGACVDACEGAVCPRGEHCDAGECVTDAPTMPPVRTDAGTSARDGGTGTSPDAGPSMSPDAGTIDRDPLPAGRSGCTVGGRADAGILSLGVLAAMALALRRRRR